VKFQINDPATQTIQLAQFQNVDPDELQQDAPAEQLDDLFAPRDDADMQAPEPQDETDFNRPFESPPATQPEVDEEQLPDGDQDSDTQEDLDSILIPESPFDEEEEDATTCQEIYNDRNCCDEEAECRERIEMLRTKTLREISMDISPPFDPLAETPEIARQRQEDRLAQAPSRQWFDRQGRLLAEGRLLDISNGEVILEQPNGQETSISGLLLGRDERCFVSAWWNLPNDCIPDEEPFPIRDFTLTTFTWTASSLCHRPLYFEDVQLERYGHSAGPLLQPFLSGAHFYTSIALLPYNMGLYPPKECMYALGYYRPGSCAPWLVSAFPITKRAILAEATAIFALYGFLH
jgi:hypothetical protein